MFNSLVSTIKLEASNNFVDATSNMVNFIESVNYNDFKDIVKEIGIIPESIQVSSTEEKLFSKTSDIVLARCFREIGLNAKPLDGRGDCADIIAQSISGYNYSLVADAKCFQLSRTAKNQKDFKITTLSNWRGEENDYAVLVAPYFEYPASSSQIYFHALDKNVCLLSWEHISILLEKGIKETSSFTLETLWGSSNSIARGHLQFDDREKCIVPKIDAIFARKIGVSLEDFYENLEKYKTVIKNRSVNEIGYWEDEYNRIQSFTREQAINELIKERKISEKKRAINKYVSNVSERIFVHE